MKINFKKPRLNEDVPLFWSLHKFFIHRLKEVLWAERELSATVLSKIIYNVGSPNLSFVIKDYKKLTKLHAAKTVKILNDAGITARGKKSPGMQSLMHEFTILFEKRKKGPVRDAAIISALQKILHYHIASYRSLEIVGRMLGEDAIIGDFESAVANIRKIDILLTDAAQNTINFDAAIDENKYITAPHYKPHNL